MSNKITEYFGSEYKVFDSNTRLSDLNFDSLDYVKLVVFLRKSLGVRVSLTDLAEAKTIVDVVKRVEGL